MGDFSRLMGMIKAGNDDEVRARIEKKLSKGVHDLMMGYEVTADILVKEELYKVILKGAEQALCMRDVLPVYRMNKNELRFIISDAASGLLPVVAPGAMLMEGPDTKFAADVTFVAQKYGERVGVPEELVDDSEFDVIEMMMYQEGRRAENRVNDLGMNALLEAKSTEQAKGETVVDTILSMIKTMRKNRYEPDMIIMTPDAEAEVLKYLIGTTGAYGDANPVKTSYEKTGMPALFRAKDIGRPIVGLKPYTLSKDVVSGSYANWAASAREICILDSKMAAGLGIRQDIDAENFDDPINDLKNVKVTMRMDAKVFFSNAIEFGKVT